MNDLARFSPINQTYIMQTKTFHHLEHFDLRSTIQWNEKLTSINIPLVIPQLHLSSSHQQKLCVHEILPEQLSTTFLNSETLYALHIQDESYDPDQLKQTLDSLSSDQPLKFVLFLSGQTNDPKPLLSSVALWRQHFPDLPIAVGPMCSATDIPDFARAGASAFRFGYGLLHTVLAEQYGISSFLCEQFAECQNRARENNMVFLADCVIHEYADIPKLFALGADGVRLDNQSISSLATVLNKPKVLPSNKQEYLVAEHLLHHDSLYRTGIDHIFHGLHMVLTVTDASTISELQTHSKLLHQEN